MLVHTDHSTPIVGVNLWYHVGSSAERRGRTGFAHLFEHFFFNGSEHHKSGFREAMDDLGANNRNGTTNTDRTNFFEDVPLSGLERTLFLEADRMGFLAANLSQEMLERERGVVQNEKRQGENQPYGRVFDRVVAAMYPYSHPYSWSTIGSMEDLNAATLDRRQEVVRDLLRAESLRTVAGRRHHAGTGLGTGAQVLRRHPAGSRPAGSRILAAAPRHRHP